MEVSFHFVEDVLGGASEDNGTGGGSFALDEEGEVVVADFADVEQSALCSDIGFLDLFGSVDNFGAGYSGDSDVVGFSDTADAGDVAFEEEVLGEVGYTFFGDDDIGFPLEDVVAHEGDLFHFLFEGVAHGVLGFEFHVGLTLSFFVFEGAVEKDDAGVSDLSSHFGVGDIFVDHDTVENFTVVESSSGDFLDSGVSFDFEVEFVASTFSEDGFGGFDGEI